jgi:hypothetical protein
VTLATTVHGSVSLRSSRVPFADVPVKGLADGEVQVLKSKALDSQGPNLAAR